MPIPTKPADFDLAYSLPFTVWGDIRIPEEIKSLARQGDSEQVLELGCGIGRLSRYMAQQGLQSTGVDFSPVAIARAQRRVVNDAVRPDFLVGDVTRLDAVRGPFDISFDVGCFHCLDLKAQKAYASEVFRLLGLGGTHLIWAMDSSPRGIALSPEAMRGIFEPGFELQAAKKSRRHLGRSHWYWLLRSRQPEFPTANSK